MSATTELDSAIRVVVTPAQSSYFAGEPFLVTISFTNTRTPISSSTPRHSHKRGAHSISSAPLARPPTSPGTPLTPRTAIPHGHSWAKSAGEKPVRKGLIGKNEVKSAVLPDLMEQRRKKLLGRSLSVTIAPKELESQLAVVGDTDTVAGSPLSSTTYLQRYQSPTSPQISSPLARSPSLPLSSSHPHVRKNSLLDGQSQLQQDISPSPTSPYYSPTPSTSNSTYSLVLDPISEGAPPYSSTPSLHSPSPQTPHTPMFSGPSHMQRSSAHTRRPSLLGLGHPTSSSSAPSLPQQPHQHLQPPRTASGSIFPHASTTELILYAYAQLTGTLTLSPSASTVPPTPDQLYTLNSLRSSLVKRTVIGGGSMDITSSLRPSPSSPPRPHHPGRSHSRSSSLTGGLLGLLAPSVNTPSQATVPRMPGHKPRSASVLGFGVGSDAEEVEPETPLPTFQVQPAMLAVDLALAPGESKSYTYSITLPDNLPPTYKGRSLKFSYEFVVGTCRAGSSVPSPSSALGPTGANSISRIMKVPVRVYNNVTVEKQSGPYDLLWPVTNRTKPMAESVVKVVEVMGSVAKPPAIPSMPLPHTGSFEELQEYAQRLIATFPSPESDSKGKSVRTKLPVEALSSRYDLEREREKEADGALTGCREAVEILTRNPKKVSYDVNKDGVKVAVLTFTKPAYRLGETVLGVVELNERTGRSRVLQLSAMLETQESLPSSISSTPTSRQTRRVHAEHHSSFVLSNLRTTFSLDIPSDATPAFKVKIGEEQKSASQGGLDWRVRLCLLVSVAAESSSVGTQGVRMKSMNRDGRTGEWGKSWKASASIAPMERPSKPSPYPSRSPTPSKSMSWSAFFVSSFLGTTEDEEQADSGGDSGGDEEEECGYGGGEEEWMEVKVETVECEVPIKVWPGNTAFKAMDVVFDV